MKDIIKKISVKNALILIVLCTFIYSAFLTINPPNKIAVLEITGVIRSPKAYLKSIEELHHLMHYLVLLWRVLFESFFVTCDWKWHN